MITTGEYIKSLFEDKTGENYNKEGSLVVKTKRNSILRTLLCAVVALCFAVGLSSLFANGTTAYAAAVTTPKYAIPITYST